MPRARAVKKRKKDSRARRAKEIRCRCMGYPFPHRKGSLWCESSDHPERQDPEQAEDRMRSLAKSMRDQYAYDPETAIDTEPGRHHRAGRLRN